MPMSRLCGDRVTMPLHHMGRVRGQTCACRLSPLTMLIGEVVLTAVVRGEPTEPVVEVEDLRERGKRRGEQKTVHFQILLETRVGWLAAGRGG